MVHAPYQHSSIVLPLLLSHQHCLDHISHRTVFAKATLTCNLDIHFVHEWSAGFDCPGTVLVATAVQILNQSIKRGDIYFKVQRNTEDCTYCYFTADKTKKQVK